MSHECGYKNDFIMKEITVSFSPDELIELAKQLYLGAAVTIGFPYDNLEMADEIFNKVCAVGFLEIPEREALRHGGPTETAFSISLDLSAECDPIVEQYEDSAIADHLPYDLADRDFEEKYCKLEVMEVLNNPVLRGDLEAIQKKYKEEFERYDVRNLRLVKEK